MKRNKDKAKEYKELSGITEKTDINPVRAKLGQLNLMVQY